MTAGQSDLIDLTLDKFAETDAAFKLSDGKRWAWLPKSQVEENDDGTYTMPEWLAVEKEFV